MHAVFFVESTLYIFAQSIKKQYLCGVKISYCINAIPYTKQITITNKYIAYVAPRADRRHNNISY